jgi:hypothetical protein
MVRAILSLSHRGGKQLLQHPRIRRRSIQRGTTARGQSGLRRQLSDIARRLGAFGFCCIVVGSPAAVILGHSRARPPTPSPNELGVRFRPERNGQQT